VFGIFEQIRTGLWLFHVRDEAKHFVVVLCETSAVLSGQERMP